MNVEGIEVTPQCGGRGANCHCDILPRSSAVSLDYFYDMMFLTSLAPGRFQNDIGALRIKRYEAVDTSRTRKSGAGPLFLSRDGGI